MKRKGFKSFVLKVCETKGFADTFFAKCVKLKSLGSISACFQLSALCSIPLRGLSGDSPSKQGGLRRTYLAGFGPRIGRSSSESVCYVSNRIVSLSNCGTCLHFPTGFAARF